MVSLVGQLADVEQGHHVRLTVSDDTVVAGSVSPMEFVPGRRLRFEVRPDDGSDARFEVVSTCEDGDWTPVRMNRIASDTNERESLGEVVSATVEYREGQTDHQWYRSGVRF